jgi:hypothetical protein
VTMDPELGETSPHGRLPQRLRRHLAWAVVYALALWGLIAAVVLVACALV